MITDKVQDMQAQIKSMEQLKTRAVKAEEDLARAGRELETLNNQATGLIEDKRRLEEDNEALRRRVGRRNVSLKLTRKEKRKADKLLALTEERCYQMGYDDAVVKAHELGWDHAQLLDEGMGDPVGRTEEDAVPEVSSGEDEDLSS